MPLPAYAPDRRVGVSILFCLCVSRAFKRYQALLFPAGVRPAEVNVAVGDFISNLYVNVLTDNENLTLTTDESYTLSITSDNATVTANTVFGALHGIETFSQLLVPSPGGIYQVPHPPPVCRRGEGRGRRGDCHCCCKYVCGVPVLCVTAVRCLKGGGLGLAIVLRGLHSSSSPLPPPQ